MGAMVKKEGDVHVVHITGLLRKAELDSVRARANADWGLIPAARSWSSRMVSWVGTEATAGMT